MEFGHNNTEASGATRTSVVVLYNYTCTSTSTCLLISRLLRDFRTATWNVDARTQAMQMLYIFMQEKKNLSNRCTPSSRERENCSICSVLELFKKAELGKRVCGVGRGPSSIPLALWRAAHLSPKLLGILLWRIRNDEDRNITPCTSLVYNRLGTCESAVCVRIEYSNRIFSTPTNINY